MERAKARLKVYETVAGSSTFQVTLMSLGTSVIKASPRLNVCVTNAKTNLVLLRYTRNTT